MIDNLLDYQQVESQLRTCLASQIHPFQLNHSSFVVDHLGPGSHLTASFAAVASMRFRLVEG